MGGYYLVKGENAKGETFYYTGKAGEEWIMRDRSMAFLYGETGAQRMAGIFNRHTGIHGVSFKAEKQ